MNALILPFRFFVWFALFPTTVRQQWVFGGDGNGGHGERTGKSTRINNSDAQAGCATLDRRVGDPKAPFMNLNTTQTYTHTTKKKWRVFRHSGTFTVIIALDCARPRTSVRACAGMLAQTNTADSISVSHRPAPWAARFAVHRLFTAVRGTRLTTKKE